MVRLDPASGSWHTVASMSTPRSYLSAFILGGHIYAAGGNVDDDTSLSSVERYDAEADSWSPVAAMSTARWGASAAVVGEAGDGGDMDLFESIIARAVRARR